MDTSTLSWRAGVLMMLTVIVLPTPTTENAVVVQWSILFMMLGIFGPYISNGAHSIIARVRKGASS